MTDFHQLENSALYQGTLWIFVNLNGPKGAKGKYSTNSGMSSMDRDASDVNEQWGERAALVSRGFQFETCGYAGSNELAHPFLDFIVLRDRVPNWHYINLLSPLCGHRQLGLGPKFPPIDTRVLLYKSNSILDVPLYEKKVRKTSSNLLYPKYTEFGFWFPHTHIHTHKQIFSFQVLQFLFFFTLIVLWLPREHIQTSEHWFTISKGGPGSFF